MKVVIPIFMLFLGVIFHASAEERFVRKATLENSEGTTVKEVYLDSKTQKVIVKEFSKLPQTATFYREDVDRLAEPWNPAPEGWTPTGQTTFDLGTEEGQNQAKSVLEESQLNTLIRDLQKGSSRYKLMQVGKRENTNLGVYLNQQRGELLIQVVDDEEHHSFPFTAGLRRDVKDSGEDKVVEFKVLPFKTLGQLNNNLIILKDDMARHGFKLPDDAFDELKEATRAYQNEFNRLHLKEEEGGIFEEVLYNPLTNEILKRKFRYDDSGDQVIISEETYDLNLDSDYTEALHYFGQIGLDTEQVFNASASCLEPMKDSAPVSVELEEQLDQFDEVLHRMWKDQLKAGLPQTPRLGPGRNQATLDFSLFGSNHPLRLDFDKHGRLRDVNFSNVPLAREKKMRIRHLKDDRGEKQFMVQAFNEATGEWESQLVLETEFILNAQGKGEARLAAYLKGEKQGESFSFDSFEKSVYPLVLTQSGVGAIRPRYRFDGSRRDEYQRVAFERDGPGGLTNIAFQLFFSKNARREKVRDTIVDEAKKALNSPMLSGLITDHDIEVVAEEVAAATGQRTNNFDQSKNRIQAVATEEAYSRFGDLALERLVAELMPDEKSENIQELVATVMRNFRACIRRASDARNSAMAENCMDIFMKEAPIDVAKEILKLKVSQAGLGEFTQVAEAEFLACTQEHYEPIKNKGDSDAGIEIVKGCLYKALIVTVDNTSKAIVDTQLGDIGRDLGLTLSYSPQRLDKARENVRTCLRSRGLGKHGVRGFEFNMRTLGRTPADLFEQNFMSCMNILVEDVAVSVGEVAVAAKLNDVELSEEAKNKVLNLGSETLRSCLQEQRMAIERYQEIYRDRKNELINQTGKEDVRVDKIVPSFNPLECNRVVSNLATGYAATETLRDLLGEAIYEDVTKNRGFDPLGCFEEKHRFMMESLPTWMLQYEGKSKEDQKTLSEARDKEMEEQTAECLKKAIGDASFYAAQKMLLETLREKPEYADIEVSDEAKLAVGLSVRRCFNEKLSSYNSVDGILAEQEKLKDVCAAELFKDPTVQKHLFTPFVDKAISQVEMSEETKKNVINLVINELGQDLQSVSTIDEAMEKVDQFTPKAIPLVLQGILEEKVFEVTKPKSDEERQKGMKLIEEVKTEIFGENGEGVLGKRLIAAVDSGDKEEMAEVISAIELVATNILGPSVLEGTALQLVEDGVLDGEEDAKLLVEKGREVLAQCLEDAGKAGISNAVDHCVVDTTVKTTEYLLRQKLDQSIVNHSLIGGILSRDQRKELADELISKERMDKLKEISQLPEGNEKDQAMDDFILTFKIDATEKVFDKAIVDIIDEKLPAPLSFTKEQIADLDKQREALGRETSELLSRCTSSLKQRMEESDHGVVEDDLDSCINEARLVATREILPKRLEFILKWVNESDLDREKLAAYGKSHFDSCSDSMNINTNGKVYGAHLDGCLNIAITNFVGDVLIDLRDKGLLVGKEKTADWNSCVRDVEERAIIHVYGKNPPAELNSLQGEELYRELSLKGEELDPPRIPDIDWLIPSLAACAFEREIGGAINEVSQGFMERQEANLKPETKEAVLTLTSTLDHLTNEAGNGGLDIDYSPVINWIEEEISTPPTPQEREKGSPEPTPIETLVRDFEPKVVELLNGVSQYDAEALNKALKDFEQSMKDKFGTRTDKVTLGELGEHLANSPLMDVLLESMIAGMVESQTKEALEAEGASTTVTQLLGSKLMINRLFGSGEGKAALDALKSEFIIPFLKGEKQSLEVPTELMGRVTDVLANDTEVNGFAETLFGPIIQKKLNDKKEWIESGWTAPFKYLGARIMGINPGKDFQWGNRFDPERNPYYLRFTPSGQKAVEHFSKELLGPMLRGELTPEREEEVTEQLTELVEQAMKENGEKRSNNRRRRN